MAYSAWAQYEDPARRSIVTTRGVMRFQTRIYAIAPAVAEDDMPAKGTLMHGESAVVSAWRVYEVPTGGLTGTAARRVTITYYILQGTVSGLVLTLDGVHRRKTADGIEYIAKCAAILQASLPTFAATYSGDTDAVAYSIDDADELWPGLYGATVRYFVSRAR